MEGDVECRFCREPLNWVEKKRVMEHMRSQKHRKAKTAAQDTAVAVNPCDEDTGTGNADDVDDDANHADNDDISEEDDLYDPEEEVARPPPKRRRKEEDDPAPGKKISTQSRLKVKGIREVFLILLGRGSIISYR